MHGRKTSHTNRVELTDSLLITHIKAYKKHNIEDINKAIIYLKISDYYPDSVKFYIEANNVAPVDSQYNAVSYTVIDSALVIIYNSVIHYYNNNNCNKEINTFIIDNDIKLSTGRSILYCPPAWLITRIGSKENIERIRDVK